MPGGDAPIPQLQPNPRSQVTSIHEKADLRESRDPAFVHHRKDLDKATVRRIVENEAAELLPHIRKAIDEAEQLKQLVAMASWSSSEKEDSLRLSLKKLEAAATL